MKQRIFTLAILALSLLTFACKRIVSTAIPTVKMDTRVYHIDPNCNLDSMLIETAFRRWNERLARDNRRIRYTQTIPINGAYYPKPDLKITCEDSVSYAELDSDNAVSRKAKRYPNKLNALYIRHKSSNLIVVYRKSRLCMNVISHEINHDIVGYSHAHSYFLFKRYHHHDESKCRLNAMTIGRNLVPIQP